MTATSDHPQRRPQRTGNGNGKPRNGYQRAQQQQQQQSQPRRIHHDLDDIEVMTDDPAQLPQDVRAEEGLIDSVIQQPDILETFGFVKPLYFFRAQHQVIWQQMQDMHEASRAIGHITLLDALRTNGKLADAGGELAIYGLGNRVTHPGFAKEFARIICEKYLSRCSLRFTGALAPVSTRGNPQEILSAWAAQQIEIQEIASALGMGADGSDTGPRHRPKTIAEMRKRTRPEWIIPGILQERKRALIFGDSNTGKSFLALDMALCIATGLPWHGRAVKQGPVIYVCAEDEDGIMDRVNLWLDYHHLDDAPDFRIIDDSPNLLETGQVAGAIAQIKAVLDDAPMLVIFDTLSASTSGGDENSAQDMGIAVGAIHRVQRECGCSVMVVHHSGKDASKGPRGYSSLRADVDIALEVSADETTSLITMRGNKMRGDDKRKINLGFRLRQFALDEHADFTSCIVEALDESPPLDTPKARRKPTATDKLLALMQEVGDAQLHGQWCTAFIKAGHGQRATFNRALEELYQAQLVECINGLYRLTQIETRE